MFKSELHPEGIDISVTTQYLQEQSDPENNRYVFAYTIGIENKREQPVKLLSRHWIITDDNDKVEEVRGSGVLGQQPLIEPGQVVPLHQWRRARPLASAPCRAATKCSAPMAKNLRRPFRRFCCPDH